MMKLQRLTTLPVLEPIADHEWERAAVFNSAMVYHNGLFHTIYRATDIGGHEKFGRYINTFGYATSKDLIHWDRFDQPILVNDIPQEYRGPEDPRIVEIDGTFYMTYTGFGGRFPNDYRICLATSQDLVNWDRKGVLLDEPNKDSALFPEKIDSHYCLFHRRYPDIWLCYSNDLKNWTDHRIMMRPIPETWESDRIGIAGPPVKIDAGWLLIYHGVDDNNAYRLGAALLDYKDPSIILERYPHPILEPELDWEINGFIPNVIFSCATVLKDDIIYCMYGGADTVLGIAKIPVNEIKF
ncbi:MAG: glycosidase [Candidatus Marinimicrobia bacterium]|nr:glycosidase [Candidatus Neomarinimicrobiota bacterium]